MRALCLALCGVGLVGCAEPEAVLERYLELPAHAAESDDDERYAIVQVRDAANVSFDAEWHASDDVSPLLLGPRPLDDHISVQADRLDVDVAIRISFCGDPRCNDVGLASAEQRWFVLERPFFAGERSEWHMRIASAEPGHPAAPEEIDRCQIRACVAGDLAADYCLMDGSHPCER